MPPTAPPHSSFFWPDIPNARIWNALELLLAARAAARSANRAAWDFAVEAHELRSAGLTTTDLRWLVSMGYAEHAQERASRGPSRRFFKRLTNLAFPRNTCFVATEKGVSLAVLGTNRIALSDSASAQGGTDRPPTAADLPRWDGVLRQLRWQGRVVKEFRLPAHNQETILAALEEEGWPPHIDDPLPPSANCDAKCRLHDAIKGLNRKQVHRLLHFRGDGTGQGVLWDVIPPAEAAEPRASPDCP